MLLRGYLLRSALCGCFDGLRTVPLRLKPEAKLVRHSLVHSFAPGMAWSRALSVAGASMSVDLDSDVEGSLDKCEPDNLRIIINITYPPNSELSSNRNLCTL